MADVNSAAGAAVGANNLAADALGKIQVQLSGVYDEANKTLEQSASDAYDVNLQVQLAKAEAEKNTREFAGAIGTDPNLANYALTQLVQKQNAAYAAQRQTAQELTVAADPTQAFNGNISGWLRAKLLERGNKEKLVEQTNLVNSYKDQINTLNSQTQQTSVTNNAIALSVTADTAAKAAELLSNEYKIKQANTQIDALKTNASMVNSVRQLKNDNFSIIAQQRGLQLREQAIAVQNKQNSIQEEMRQLQLKAKQEQDAAGQTIIGDINTGLAASGSKLKFSSIAELEAARKLDPDLDTVLSAARQSGQLSRLSDGTITTIADSPAASLDYVSKTRAQLDPARAQIVGTIKQIDSDTKANTQLMAKVKTQKQYQALLNDTVKNQAQAWQGNIEAGAGNIYKMVPADVLSTDPGLEGSYVDKEYLKPLVQGGGKTVKISDIANTLIKGIKDGKITVSEASSELSFIGIKAKSYNNATFRYSELGLPPQEKVNAELPTTKTLFRAPPAGFGPANIILGGTSATTSDMTKPIDISNTAAVDAYFNSQAATSVLPPVLKAMAEQIKKVGN